MNHQLAAKTYQEVQMTVSDRRRILIMAFEGMIKFLRQSQKAMQEKEIETAHERLIRTKQILYHLLNGLDMKNGGEIAQNLKRLYLFLIEKITEANLKKDPVIVDEILPIFKNLCSAWEEMSPHTEGKPEDKPRSAEKNHPYPRGPVAAPSAPPSHIQAVG